MQSDRDRLIVALAPGATGEMLRKKQVRDRFIAAAEANPALTIGDGLELAKKIQDDVYRPVVNRKQRRRVFSVSTQKLQKAESKLPAMKGY